MCVSVCEGVMGLYCVTECATADIVPHMHVCVRVFVWVDVNVCIYACVGMCLQKFLWLCRISNIVMHV